MKTTSFARANLRWWVSAVLLALASPICAATRAESRDMNRASEGWKTASARDEIRPTFAFKRDGGPAGHGSLLIRADDREGLDGHWVKTFPVEGGRYYHFRAMRRVTNVAAPLRSVLALLLWRVDMGQPVRRDGLGGSSSATGEAWVAARV